MRITQSEFVTSAPTLKEAPDWELPEIALLGRSNVGKSSFINTLANRKNLAKTSNTPGKTRLMNFYRINDQFSFVDLPGYGYAKVSKTMQNQWQHHLENYLLKRNNLVLMVLLIDARHDLQKADEAMLGWLSHQTTPFIVVMTKTDKLSRNDLGKHQQQLAKAIGVKLHEIFTFSAQTGWGKDVMLDFLGSVLEAPAEV